MPSLTDEPDPRAETLPYPSEPSQSLLTKCYLCFVVLGGNVGATAKACNVHPDFIQEHCEREDWKSRLDAINNLCAPTSRTPAEVERLLNRAALYVQAMRIRRVVDAVLSELETKASQTGPGGLLALFTVNTKDGSRVDLKPLSDLASAAAKLGALAQTVMCDSTSERVRRLMMGSKAEREGGLGDTVLMGKNVLEALNKMPDVVEDPEELAFEAVTEAASKVAEVGK